MKENIVMIKDSESKLKEYIEALRRSEERYHTVLDSSPGYIFLLNRDGNILDLNLTCEEIGTPEMLVTAPLYKYVYEKDADLLKCEIEACLTTNRLRDFEVRNDDRSFYYQVLLAPVHEIKGEPETIVCTMYDITERKRAEARLSRETERTKLLLELYLKAPQLTDKDLYDYALEKTVSLTESTIGFFHMIADDQKTIILTTWNNEALKNCTATYDTHYSIDGAGNWVDCVRFKRPVIYNDFPNSPNQKGLPEGHTPVERFMSIPVIEGKKVRFIFGVGNKPVDYDEHDVDQLQLVANKLHEIIKSRRAEEELRKHREHLEELVMKRTSELKERTAELEQANVQLQEADRLKSVFLASMSHELRTPLNSIIGFTGIILQGLVGDVSEEQRKQLTMVKRSANHLLDLINDLLDISKIEAGKAELLIEQFDLSTVMQEVKDSFSFVTDEKGLKMPLKMPKGLVIKSDERRVKQIIVNLVGNAVKFTDEGEVEIKLAEKDGIAEISVRDTGPGIRKEHMDKLFKAFSQMPTEGEQKEGSGLGLYLSKKIAELLGGEISAESEFGSGSGFTFTLPLEYEEVKI